MSENYRTQIEELLTALIDDQATERQKNEFARLAQHDPAINDELKALQRQKQLLAALPVETAPTSLAADISSALQRKMILGETPNTQDSKQDTGYLMMQRFLTTAAMLLLPLGMLAFVVFQIIKPASVNRGNYIPTDQMLVQTPTPSPVEPAAKADVMNLPFEGILTFRTDKQMTVSNYVEKAISDQKLMNLTLPNRTLDVTTYQITASPPEINDLLELLRGLWYQSQDITLTVVDGSENKTIQIPNVLLEQVQQLTGEDNPAMMTYLASQYAKANEETVTSFAKSDMPDTTDPALEDYPPLTMPIPTGRYNLDETPTIPTGPTIRLRIHIKRAVK